MYVHFYLLTMIYSICHNLNTSLLSHFRNGSSHSVHQVIILQIFPRVIFSSLCLRELANLKKKTSLLLLGNGYFFHHIDSSTFC